MSYGYRGIIDIGGAANHARSMAKGAAVNATATVFSCISFSLGLTMMLSGMQMADECKISSIDASSWNNPEKRGNIPSWFVYTGGLLMATSGFACCTIGCFPLMLRGWSPIIGGAIADVLTGLCGKLVMLIVYILILTCDLLGSIWIALASPHVTFQPSTQYCHPFLWYTANIITKSFWIVAALLLLEAVAKVHSLIRGGAIVQKLKSKRRKERRNRRKRGRVTRFFYKYH